MQMNIKYLIGSVYKDWTYSWSGEELVKAGGEDIIRYHLLWVLQKLYGVWCEWHHYTLPPSFQQHLRHLIEFQEPLERRETKAGVRSGWKTTLVFRIFCIVAGLQKAWRGFREEMLLYLLYSEHQRDEWIEWVNQSREMENILLLLTDYLWKWTEFRNWFGKHLVWLCYSIALYFCINIS